MSDKRKPWFAFHTSDWRGDAGLRSVSFAARGLWADMLSLMHEATPYGHLVLNGEQISLGMMAKLVGGKQRELATLMEELERANVFSRTGEGTIYSRRMTRDHERAERDRINGLRGGSPLLRKPERVNPPDNPPHNQTLNGEDKSTLKAERLETIFKKELSPPRAREADRNNSRLSDEDKRGSSRLRENWVPSGADLAFAMSLGLNSTATPDNFRDWHLSRGTELADWSAEWRRWCRGDAERALQPKPAQHRPSLAHSREPQSKLAYLEQFAPRRIAQ